MKNNLFSFLLIMSFKLKVLQCSNILVLATVTAKSHLTIYENLLKELARKGHNLTVISYYPQKEPIPNYRDVCISTGDNYENRRVPLGLPGNTKLSMWLGIFGVAELAHVTCPKLLSHKNVHNFLRENNTFDLILFESFNTNCDLGIAKKFKAPIVVLHASSPYPWMTSMIGLPDNPAYIHNPFFATTTTTSFFQRVENTLCVLMFKIIYSIIMKKSGNEYSKMYLGEDILNEYDMERNVSLMLMNSHHTFEFPRPLVPGTIEVGGIHINEQKNLPQDIQDFADHATDGIIFISMGSILISSSIPVHILRIFLETFSHIPQKIIWKWENDTMEGKPNNVMTTKWAPQRDLLCHPNVKVFISHGGISSIYESITCGVPMLLFPQYGDQMMNGALVQERGCGISMNLNDVSTKSLTENLKKILSGTYRENMRELSIRFWDRPQPPLQTAIYWIEYVIKHRGAKHMRTIAVDMPFYQYYLLDVIAFLFALLLITAILLYRMYSYFLNILIYRK